MPFDDAEATDPADLAANDNVDPAVLLLLLPLLLAGDDGGGDDAPFRLLPPPAPALAGFLGAASWWAGEAGFSWAAICTAFAFARRAAASLDCCSRVKHMSQRRKLPWYRHRVLDVAWQKSHTRAGAERERGVVCLARFASDMAPRAASTH